MARRWLPIPIVLAGVLGGCPAKDDVPDDAERTQPLELPDRLRSGEAAVLLRIWGEGGASTTSTAVHRALSALLTEQSDALTAVMRGGRTPALEGEDPYDRIAGTAADQAEVLLQRVLVDGEGPFASGEVTDRCTNPMIASFLTPDVLLASAPEGTADEVADLLSDDALGDGDGADTTAEGIWDVTLTETRLDGMVDVILQLYPAVREERPGFLGHLAALFLTEDRPGSWQWPLYLSVEKVQVSLQALLERDRSGRDDRYGGAFEVYRFPHQERTVQRKDVSVVLLGDPLCDEHHDRRFDGPQPLGCKLDDGRDLPVQLDVGSPVGDEIATRLLADGTDTSALEEVSSVLSYQVAAFLACPSFSEPLWARRDAVELMVCPDGDVSACLGFHDQEQAGCDYRDDTLYPASTVSAGDIGEGTPVPVTPSSLPVEIEPVDELFQDDMAVTLSGTRGIVTLATAARGRLTVRGPGGAELPLVDREDSHCSGTILLDVDLPDEGEAVLEIDGTAPLRVLVSTPGSFTPP